MGKFLIKQYRVMVHGFPEHVVYAASPGKARVKSWEAYRCAYDQCTFKDFLKTSVTRRGDDSQLPERFGDAILVSGRPAYWVKTDGQYVWFVREGEETILLSHPLDVTEVP